MQQLNKGCVLQGGKYTIKEVLGEGGFGITYKGFQHGLERDVAIKEFFISSLCNRDVKTGAVSIGSQGGEKTVETYKQKFLKEARVLAQLNHPHIVHVFDVFEENGTAYYVMDYVEGGSISHIVKRDGRLSEVQALEYITQLADALDYLHQKHILHLDVKPANVLLNDHKEIVLVDFGISKRYDNGGRQTSSTPVGISAGYAPVEQYSQDLSLFSPATDVYSLGATYYYMLTGNNPPHSSALAGNVSKLDIPDFLSLKSRKALLGAMKPSRQDRFQSAKEFMSVLQDQNDYTLIDLSEHVDTKAVKITQDSHDGQYKKVQPGQDQSQPRHHSSKYLSFENNKFVSTSSYSLLRKNWVRILFHSLFKYTSIVFAFWGLYKLLWGGAGDVSGALLLLVLSAIMIGITSKLGTGVPKWSDGQRLRTDADWIQADSPQTFDQYRFIIKSNRWGVYDTKLFCLVIQPEYEKISWSDMGRTLLVKKDGCFYYIHVGMWNELELVKR